MHITSFFLSHPHVPYASQWKDIALLQFTSEKYMRDKRLALLPTFYFCCDFHPPMRRWTMWKLPAPMLFWYNHFLGVLHRRSDSLSWIHTRVYSDHSFQLCSGYSFSCALANVEPSAKVRHPIQCFFKLTRSLELLYVNVICRSTAWNNCRCELWPGRAGNGAQLHKWELYSWPRGRGVESRLEDVLGERRDGWRLREPQPTLQLKLLSHPFHVPSLFIRRSFARCSLPSRTTTVLLAIISAPSPSRFKRFPQKLPFKETYYVPYSGPEF